MKKGLLPFFITLSIVSIIGNVLFYFRYSSQRPLITVNNEAITRKDLQDRVDYLYANSLLASMIWQKIVLQEAQADNCVPSDSDVDAALAELQRTTPAVVQNAKRLDPSLIMFKADLKMNLALRNIRMEGVTASPSEVQAYYTQHLSQYKLPQQTQTTFVIATNSIDAAIAQRLLQNGDTNETIVKQPGLHIVGFNANLTQPLPEVVGQEVLSMKPGEVKTIPIAKDFFGIVKAKAVADEGIPPLSSIENQVKIDCILAKAPSEVEVLKALRTKATIVANVDTYKDAIPNEPSDTSPFQSSSVQ